MPVYSFDGVTPVVDPTAFIHPTAVLIGDVIVGPRCFVGANAVLRGDLGRIQLGEGANFQETCVAHAFPGKDTIVEDLGHIGHGAVLHGCTIKRNALIGMNAVVMDDAVVGENCIVGAASFVKGQQVIPDNHMAAGSPAKIIRELSEKEIDWKTRGTEVYHMLAERSLATLEECQPLIAVEPDRRRVTAVQYTPKKED